MITAIQIADRDGLGGLSMRRLADVLGPARYPTAVRLGAAVGAEYGAAHDSARSFRFGLQRIIDGIAIFVGQASR